MSSYAYSSYDLPTSAQYLYSGNNKLVKNSASYSSLGAYNIGNPTQFTAGPPVPTMSETVVQIVPSYGGVGYASSASPSVSGGTSNYYSLNGAYCCGASTCQTVTTPLANTQNVLKSIYNKR
jgi:hypothetical protein